MKQAYVLQTRLPNMHTNSPVQTRAVLSEAVQTIHEFQYHVDGAVYGEIRCTSRSVFLEFQQIMCIVC